jgi:hypothetical protein
LSGCGSQLSLIFQKPLVPGLCQVLATIAIS